MGQTEEEEERSSTYSGKNQFSALPELKLYTFEPIYKKMIDKYNHVCILVCHLVKIYARD